MRLFLLIILFLSAGQTSLAFSVEDNPNLPPAGYEPIKVDDDSISWDVFAKTKDVEKCFVDEEGYDDCRIYPEYSKEILALNGEKITLMGFMFPLTDDMAGQTNFLFGPYPLSCPFNYHSPPSQMVEVVFEDPVKFSFDPIKITGTLEVSYNKETGVFYYLKN